MLQLGTNTESYNTALTELLSFWWAVGFGCRAEIWSFPQQAGDAYRVSRHGVKFAHKETAKSSTKCLLQAVNWAKNKLLALMGTY